MEAQTQRQVFGLEIEADQWQPQRNIIARPEVAPVGNLVLRVGEENVPGGGEGWHQIAHVVLKPHEAAEFVLAIRDSGVIGDTEYDPAILDGAEDAVEELREKATGRTPDENGDIRISQDKLVSLLDSVIAVIVSLRSA